MRCLCAAALQQASAIDDPLELRHTEVVCRISVLKILDIRSHDQFGRKNSGGRTGKASIAQYGAASLHETEVEGQEFVPIGLLFDLWHR